MGRLNRVFPAFLLRIALTFLSPRLGRALKDGKFDFILAHHTLVSGQIAQQMGSRHDVPYLVTDHEVGDLIGCRTNQRQKEVFERVSEGAEAMVVVSEAMRKEGATVLPQVPFKVIYNGSSFPIFERGNTAATNSDESVVFCCAKFYGRKDIPLLLRAFEQLAEIRSNWVLRIAGDGPDRSLIEGLVAEMDCRERIHLLGLVSPTEVRAEMVEADIFALVGWAEPFGVVFLEAMACGLPIVVSSDAGVAEVLENEVSAIFSEPQNLESVVKALTRLMADGELRNRIGKAGQKLFEREFGWQEIIKQYEDLMKVPSNRETAAKLS